MIAIKEELLSVGIDIGTSTTQLVFSKLTVENMASSFTVPRIGITSKDIIYKSDIHFTPLVSPVCIDAEGVRKIVDDEYKKAGIAKADIDTGAVIITGETARKDNADEVLRELSGFAGDFVVATAGADLESIISGKGAGTDKYSKEHICTAVNIDIGGGTSNLAVFRNGEVIDTGCMDIGGRLIKIDRDTKRITYITDKLKSIAESAGITVNVGDTASEEGLSGIVRLMVKGLEQSVNIEERDALYERLKTHKSIEKTEKITHISFSGGVADYIYNDYDGDDLFKYGDIGILLGREIQKSRLFEKFEVIKSRETIRATVVGAGSHTMEVSGSTIEYTKDVFPMKNLPIIKIPSTDYKELAKSISERIEWFCSEDGVERLAVAFEGHKNPAFDEIEYYAEQIVLGTQKILQNESTLIVVVENDMAKVLGQAIYKKLDYKKDVVCIDSIRLDNGDYIDIGSPIADGMVLPVVIKTLVFN